MKILTQRVKIRKEKRKEEKKTKVAEYRKHFPWGNQRNCRETLMRYPVSESFPSV